jgi:hypothetical protein
MRTIALPLLGIILSLLGPSPARAELDDQAIIDDFRAVSVEIPQDLLHKGYSRFGRLDLGDLLKSIASTHAGPSATWITRPEGPATDAENRSSAQWIRDANGAFILLNKLIWLEKPRPVRAVLALHEELGVAGFNDHDYGISSGLWLLTQPRLASLSAGEKAGIENGITVQSGGGITGVGGGGDEEAVAQKLELLGRDLDQLASAPADRPERGSAMQTLQTDLARHISVRRKLPPDSPQARERARDVVTTNFYYCKRLLAASPEFQLDAFTFLQNNSPADSSTKFKTIDDMLNFCRYYVKRGLKEDLVGATP